MAVPIPEEETSRNPIFREGWADPQADLEAKNLSADERLRLLTSIFEEIWQERVGENGPADDKTRDDMLLWGTALSDEVPLRHIALVSVADQVKVIMPPIGSCDVFMKWKDEKLPALIQQQWGAAA